jgi:hypothetical protein
MTSMSNTSMTPTEFERLLDVYGGDRTRWPIEARAAAAHLVARDAGAQRLLAEAEALDRVLERAPLPALAKEAALADRIVAAAQRSPRIVKIGGLRAAETAEGSAATRVAPIRPRHFGGRIGAAGLLVASLVLGVVIGRTGLAQQVLPGLADIAGLGPNNLTQVALYDEDLQ